MFCFNSFLSFRWSDFSSFPIPFYISHRLRVRFSRESVTINTQSLNRHLVDRHLISPFVLVMSVKGFGSLYDDNNNYFTLLKKEVSNWHYITCYRYYRNVVPN